MSAADNTVRVGCKGGNEHDADSLAAGTFNLNEKSNFLFIC
jgi:hypothetical protein